MCGCKGKVSGFDGTESGYAGCSACQKSSNYSGDESPWLGSRILRHKGVPKCGTRPINNKEFQDEDESGFNLKGLGGGGKFDLDKVLGTVEKGIGVIDKGTDTFHKIKNGGNKTTIGSVDVSNIGTGSGDNNANSSKVLGFQVPKPLMYGLGFLAFMLVVGGIFLAVKRTKA